MVFESERDRIGAVGSLGVGVRVVGRLTPELILRSPQYMNCLGQYELDLRGNRITTIENLGATQVSHQRRQREKCFFLVQFFFSSCFDWSASLR